MHNINLGTPTPMPRQLKNSFNDDVRMIMSSDSESDNEQSSYLDS